MDLAAEVQFRGFGIVDSIAIPLEPTLPPKFFTNQYYTPKDCGFLSVQETIRLILTHTKRKQVI